MLIRVMANNTTAPKVKPEKLLTPNEIEHIIRKMLIATKVAKPII